MKIPPTLKFYFSSWNIKQRKKRKEKTFINYFSKPKNINLKYLLFKFKIIFTCFFAKRRPDGIGCR